MPHAAATAIETLPEPQPLGEGESLTLLHFGDLHVWRLGWDGDFYFKRLLGQLNLRLRRGRKFPETIARAVAARLAAETADCIVFSGDLTTTSLRAEFALGRELLAPLRQAWGRRFIAIPGNHDRYTPRATRLRLYETLFDDSFQSAPASYDIDGPWTLVTFDVCVPRLFSSRGKIDDGPFARLKTLLELLRSRGRRIIVMSHYPIAYPTGMTPSWEHVLPGRERLLELLQANAVALYLHGHKHSRWKLNLDGLLVLNCGSAGYDGSAPERRPGYLKIHLTRQAVARVEAIYWSGEWISEPL